MVIIQSTWPQFVVAVLALVSVPPSAAATCVRVSWLAAAGSLRAAITLVLIGLLSATSLAVTRFWDGGGGADTRFTTDANWILDIEPGASDTAEFDGRGATFTYTVTFPFLAPFGGDITTDRLIVGDAVTFEPDHSNTNYLVTNPATDEAVRGVIIGEKANNTAAALTSHLDLLSTRAATLGHVAGSSGTLTLNQNNDQFNVTGSSADDTELIIGRYGTGVVSVSGGAEVNVNGLYGTVSLGEYAGSNGTASINGTDSTWSVAFRLFVGSAGTGTFNVTGGAKLDSNRLHIGNDGDGTLNVTAGGQVNSYLGFIALNTGSSGTATVSGADSTWTSTTELYVGFQGAAMLNILGGGVVTNGRGFLGRYDTSIASARVDGAGSVWTNSNDLYVGYSAKGTLDMAGGTLDITAGGGVSSVDGYIGYISDSTGEVTVDGLGSSWTNRVLHVGSQGNGTLTITNQGQVASTGIGVIADGTGSISKVTVDGQGSRWALDNDGNDGLYIGNGGDGTLNVTNGGQVNSAVSFIANGTGSSGTVTVDGPGSTWTTRSTLHVGYSGNGTLNITGGAQVRNEMGIVTSSTYIGKLSGSTGNVVVDGAESMFTNFGDLFVGNLGDGTLVITNGATTTAANVIVGSLGEIHGDGNIVGVVQNGGLVSPGMSPGALHIDEDYTQTAAGELLIELASASSYDQLLVIDNATLAGTLTVNLIDGFIPSVAQTFTILTADDVDGTFDLEMLPSVPNLAFDVIYNAQSVVLAVLSALPGDFNGDGTVDAADYVVWRKGLGTIYTPDDFDVWRAHFGQTVGSGSGTAAESPSGTVPEPTSALLLVLGAAAMCCRVCRVALQAPGTL